jgi:hypothetical protein
VARACKREGRSMSFALEIVNAWIRQGRGRPSTSAAF